MRRAVRHYGVVMDEELAELTGLALDAKLLAEAILIDRVRSGEITLARARAIIASCLGLVDALTGDPKSDPVAFTQVRRALVSSDVSLVASTEGREPG